KAHPAFRMSTTEMIQQHLKFVDSPAQTVAYTISGNANGDSFKDILVVMNGKNTKQQVTIPKGNWRTIVANGKVDEVGLGTQKGGKLTIDGIDLMVLVAE
ncbi:MAG: type I pullulanase, partial [Chitinophagales bacterium]